MKICSHCGTVMADEYTVCSACGMVLPAPQAQEPEVGQTTVLTPETNGAATAVQAPAQEAYTPPTQPAYVPPAYVPPTAPAVNYAPVQVPKIAVSMWRWVGRYALNLIPFVGGLVYFIMLFVWAFDNKYDDTSRNWAKAQLIIMAAVLVLTVVLAVAFITVGVGLTREIFDSGYYY